MDGRNWRVVHSIAYHTNVNSVTVPAGFITDLASVPRIFWAVFPPFGKYTRAATLHDWLYRSSVTSRAVADAIFLEAMEADGVSFATRAILYSAVRLFGWAAFKRKRRSHD